MRLPRPCSPLEDEPFDMDSDSSEKSFRPGSDSSSGSESEADPATMHPMSLETPRLSLNCHQSKRRQSLSTPEDYSDDPDDDTDEDIQDVPLDYGRSEKTKARGDRIERRWQKYCRVKASEVDALQKWNDPIEAIRLLEPNDAHRFLNYCLKLTTGQDRRRLKGIKKASALIAEWKSFRGFYRRKTRTSITPEHSEEINAGIRKLIDKYNLDRLDREKIPVYVQDLTEFNETVLRTSEKRFHYGYERIQICLFTMLGIFTVNRLSALLALQFKHLQFSIQKDPDGGPPVLLVEIKSEHTKKFLGTSQMNNFPLPEIIDDPTLIFSPHFPGLDSMEQLRQLFIQNGRQQMELPLKTEVENSYVFCKTNIVNGEAVLQWDKPMTEGVMSGRLKTLGEIHGWLHSMFAHRFRYGGGKMLNENDTVSEAQQNLIMKHANIQTFLNHYLPRNIDTDMQNVMNGRASNKNMMRAITRMSRWIDRRRPRHLTVEQRASLREHPDYMEATRKMNDQAKLCVGTASDKMQARLEELTRERANTLSRLGRALQKKTRTEFDRKQAIIDIGNQLSGASIEKKEAKEAQKTEDAMLPEQIELVGKLFTWPINPSLEAECQRRNTAVAAISQYCPTLEGGPLRGRRKRRAPSDGFDKEVAVVKRPSGTKCESSVPCHRVTLLEEAEEHIRTAKTPQRCFQCYGNTLLPIHRRTQEWSAYKSTLRHFRERHLKDRHCNMCNEDLLHEMHLRRHAQDVHRLCTQRPGYGEVK
ncbi:hypothetical protein N7495_001986 [Penicillium taxi]|uniref:uncharacterized protein n=1 Tax=Penicillium taxi TaxID=168475 RepID=UPI0025457B90|nr:uncharacterized protein N7495_001986 [Penicillium taxi]KAJ5901458.1 hypothetical protein N7495_001986 [Penicillium taxi]